jgi:hypothetical protein
VDATLLLPLEGAARSPGLLLASISSESLAALVGGAALSLGPKDRFPRILTDNPGE